jgi:hypothetical protein
METFIRLERECKRLKTNRSRYLTGLADCYFAWLDGKRESPIPDKDCLMPQPNREKS